MTDEQRPITEVEIQAMRDAIERLRAHLSREDYARMAEEIELGAVPSLHSPTRNRAARMLNARSGSPMRTGANRDLHPIEFFAELRAMVSEYDGDGDEVLDEAFFEEARRRARARVRASR